MDKIHIVGIGSDGLAGLTARARSILTEAEMILGTAPILNLVSEIAAERIPIGADLQEMVSLLNVNLGRKRIVILASGDPLFYGVARYLCERVGEEYFDVLPHVSSMQLAFARVKESWDEAFLTDLTAHPLETVLDRIRVTELVGLFTSEKEGPAHIARELLANGLDYFRAYVCENLGAPNERVTQGELSDIQGLEFGPLNVMILKRKTGRPDRQAPRSRYRRFGNPDDAFAQSRPKSGLITQAEVRAMALAQMDVAAAQVIWDVGAGSGSVAIEAAQLAPRAMVYAIEQDATDFQLIVANAHTFGVYNLKPVHGAAPEVFENLPLPDAVFIDGTGHEVSRLFSAVYSRLQGGGHLVVNVATLEMLGSAYSTLKSLNSNVAVQMINLARGVEQMEAMRFEALNPTFLLSLCKNQATPHL